MRARGPLGVCVVGGLPFAQLMTLYLTPVFYTYMDVILKKRRTVERHAIQPQQIPEAADAAKPFVAHEAKHATQD